MNLRLKNIEDYISKLPFVNKLHNIEQGDFYIKGKVEIAFKELEGTLDFDFEIAPQYPLKSYDSESITFRNKNLISFSHVMATGNICIHTSHNTNLENKIKIDFDSLKNWIKKYYIDKENDSNYEHILVAESSLNERYYAYCFTDSESNFDKGEYGEVKLSYLNEGTYKDKAIFNFFIQSFYSNKGNSHCSGWSNIYKGYNIVQVGFYYFIEESPAIYGKFAFNNWAQLSEYVSTDFLNLMHRYEEDKKKESSGSIVPLFLGYKINENKIHWQVCMLEIGSFPLVGIPEKVNGIKTGKWNSGLADVEIVWGLTRNASYEYFFGRGTFSRILTNKKILIIGVGAIGSIIGKTLTRGGCSYIDFVDHDIKEPENVCRSEYFFSNGITDKTSELKDILTKISPFLNTKKLKDNYFEVIIKTYHSDKRYRKNFVNELNNYDLIFDCSTDNDLMYVLDSMNLNTEIVNISITNHARELVCAFYPNIYRFVNNQFSNVLHNDIKDLYNPTGCWNPTFKASYNDINTLVQLALRHINSLFEKDIVKNNFVIQEENLNSENLKIVEF